MTRKRKFLLGAVVAIGVGAIAVAFTGVGSQTLNTAKLELFASAMAHGGHHRGHGIPRLCSEARTEHLDAGIGFVEAFFSFDDDQKPAWEALETALREGGEMIGQHCAAMRGRPSDAPGRLERLETLLAAGLDVVRKVRPAFARFYETLDADQKAAIDRIADGNRHRRD